jgi:TPR repeat protein
MEWSVKGAQYADFVENSYSTFGEAKTAVEYYRKAAELGDAWGMIQYARSFNFNDDHGYCKKAKETNDLYAQWYFSLSRYIGCECLLVEAAKTGNTAAMYLLWNLYSNDLNTKKGVYFEQLQKSASQGHILAQYNMGIICEEDERNITKAYSWFKKSKTYVNSWSRLTNRKYRNCELHENSRNAIFTLICIKKHTFVFAKDFTMDVILIITHFLWDTRNEKIWNFNLK